MESQAYTTNNAPGLPKQNQTDPLKEMFGRVRVELTKTAGRLNQ